jgi:putative membrane fusion protein
MSMAAFLVIGKRRIKFRFFVILALLLSGTVYLLFGNHSEATYATINYGKLEVAHNGLAVIIRDETVEVAPAYGRAVFLVADGAAVEENEPIAVLYKENFDESIVKQLYDVQERIVKYQQEQLIDKAIDNDLTKVNNNLQSLVSEIQKGVRDEKYIDAAKFEGNLRKLLDTKQKFLDLTTEPDDYLKDLYDKEASLILNMNQWTIDVRAPKSGLISFTVDGLENVLGISSVDRFTLDDYTSLIQQIPEPDSTDQVNNELLEGEAQAEAEQPLYRMVNPQDNWYSIVRCEGTESYLEKGDILEAVFDGQAALPAKVIRIQKEKDCFLLTLEFTEQVDKIINKRMLPLRIQKTVEGLLMPEKALMKSKGRQGVYIRDNEEKRFIETSVQAKQDGYAIVESVSDTQALKLHDQVLTDKE